MLENLCIIQVTTQEVRVLLTGETCSHGKDAGFMILDAGLVNKLGPEDQALTKTQRA